MTYGTTQWRRALFAVVLFVVLVFSLTTTASFASPSHSPSVSGEPGASEVEAAGSERGSGQPVVVIGFSGVMWKNVTPELMPNLYRFVGDATGANIVVRTVGETTCPNEGWLTVGAGQRATDTVRDCRAQEAPAPAGASGVNGLYKVPQWETYLQSNRSSSFRARIGWLGSQLDGKSLAAIGPGAALALANSEGTLKGTYADVPALPGSVEGTTAGNADPGITAASSAYAEIAAGRDLAMVDLGSVRYPEVQLRLDASGANKRGSDSAFEKFKAAFRAAGKVPPEVEPQLAALDARFGALLKAIESAGGASGTGPRIMVMSVGDSQNLVPQLGFFAMRNAGSSGSGGEGDDGGAVVGDETAAGSAQLATSDATRQWGLVQLTDVFPTILGSVHPDSPALATSVGAEIRHRGETFEDGQASELAARLIDDQIRSEIVRPLVGPFYVLLFLAFAVVGVAGWHTVRKESGGETPRWLPAAAAWSASLPVASLLVNLLPWWRSPVPSVALFGGTAVIAVVIAAVGLLTPIRSTISGPATIIGGITALTLLLDILLDAFTLSFPLQVASLVGTQPQVGGRFYGLSNATFAMMTAGLLLMVACESVILARQSRKGLAAAFVGTVGILTLFIDGSAMLGADFGGPPALVVGFTLLLLLVCGIRLTPLRLLSILIAAIGTSLAFATVDYMKPPQQRSHLGRFIQSLLDGGGFDILTRKLSQAFFGLPWWLVVILLVVALVAGLRWWKTHEAKPATEAQTMAGVAWQSSETLRYSVISIGSALVLGMIMNDSGIVVPAIGGMVAGPLWLIMVLRHNEGSR